MTAIAFNRAALLVARPAPAPAQVMPAPKPYQAPDVARVAAVNVVTAAANVLASASAPAPAPAASSPCGGRCSHSASPATGGGPSAAIAAPLVMTGGESPTSGALDLSQLPNPADVAGDFKTPPPAGTPATDKDNAVWLWLIVLAVAFFVLSEGKGGRKLW